MRPRLSALLQEWALSEWAEKESIFLDHDAIQYLGRKAYDDYEPAPYGTFEDRLDDWLHNVDQESEQRDLYRLLGRLFFVGRPEFESLCRAAHHGPVLRWLVDELGIKIDEDDAGEKIDKGLAETWFCPVTDSMRINSYFKVNRIQGRSHQPDWRSLRKFGEGEKILKYIEGNGIRRIVLLEDFVGTGTQLSGALEFAADLTDKVSLLGCPLIVCPEGDQVGMTIAQKYPNLTYEPVLRVPRGMLIKPAPQAGEPELHASIRKLTASVRDKLAPPGRGEESFHGFKGTGAVIAMYSNCPNNSLPIIRDQTEQWDALFPRIRRN